MTTKSDTRQQIVNSLTNAVILFLHLFIAMYLSELLVETPAFGGALLIAGQFWVVFVRLYGRHTIQSLPAAIRAKGLFIFIVSVLLNVALLFIYPWIMSRSQSWLLLFSILLILARQIITEAIAYSGRSRRLPALIVTHLLFVLGGSGVFLFRPFDDTSSVIFLCLTITALPLLLRQLLLLPELPQLDLSPEPASPDDIMQVQSYRIYNRMVVNVLVALNLSITTYVFYLRYLPYTGFLSSFVGLLLWLIFTMAITGIFTVLLRRRTHWRYEKTTLFVVGVVFWVLPTLLISNGRISLSGSGKFLIWALFGFSLACMLSIIVSMGIEMKSVIELGVGKIDNGSYARNTRVMVDWSVLVSLLLILAMFTLASFIMDGQIAVLDELPVLPRVMQLLFLLTPLVCVVLSLVYLVLQPLDRRYVAKLREYRAGIDEGEPNPAMEDLLRRNLVASYPRRIGVRIAKFVVRPFFRLKLVHREKVRHQPFPVIFVCNHYELYGPLAVVLRLPYYFRPWIIYDAVERDLIAGKLTDRLGEMMPWMPKGITSTIAKIAAPIANWIVAAQDPIPVYRDNSRAILKTINQTVDALEAGDNILIFPEDRTKGEGGKFTTDGVGEFFTGFASIGRIYHKKTGKNVAFIPVFINKNAKTMTFGNSVVYDPDNNKTAEKERIVQTLYSRMDAMSE